MRTFAFVAVLAALFLVACSAPVNDAILPFVKPTVDNFINEWYDGFEIIVVNAHGMNQSAEDYLVSARALVEKYFTLDGTFDTIPNPAGAPAIGREQIIEALVDLRTYHRGDFHIGTTGHVECESLLQCTVTLRFMGFANTPYAAVAMPQKDKIVVVRDTPTAPFQIKSLLKQIHANVVVAGPQPLWRNVTI